MLTIKKREYKRISFHLTRARKLNVSADLTIDQWLTTLDDLNWKCAYCLTAPYEEMDHFVPMSKGGNTSMFDCVPSCHACNVAKGRHHPLEVTAIPYEALTRVYRYLVSKVKCPPEGLVYNMFPLD